MKAVYLPHGGGPLPLLGDPGHAQLGAYLKNLGQTLQPASVVLVSAHWECPIATVQSAKAPPMLFDYHGFPDESYAWSYPAPGHAALTQRIKASLAAQGIDCRADADRGFDHGVFVPLMLMWPKANIPVIQLSLLDNMDAEAHLTLGRALASALDDETLLIGSGFSFHNIQAGLRHEQQTANADNVAFEAWLQAVLQDTDDHRRWQALAHWEQAPGARYCPPREEHLLPLHVCAGAMGRAAETVDSLRVMGAHVSCISW